MGLHDRDYMQADPPRGGPAPGFRLSATLWLIIINVAIELMRYLAPVLFAPMFVYGYFSTERVFLPFLEFWRFVTFQFLHGGIYHLAFNMIGLFMLGRLVEDQLGAKKYLAFYLVCGIAGALFYLLLNLLGSVLNIQLPGLLFNDPSTPLVGASAGVFGVVMACAYIAPNARIQLLFPPIPMKMSTFAYGYVAITVALLVFGASNAGGNAAHLGGAAAGWYFIRNSHHLIDFFDVLGDSRKPKGAAKTRGGRRRRGGGNLRLAGSDAVDAPSDAEVDRILKKISDRGAGSLSDAERDALSRATRSQRRP
ncbi:MAG: rhomboid family intramembrane serine protease [Planctomycetota bacterium]